jgi:hypothetical protein
VQKLLSLDARYRMARATSSAVPSLPIGTLFEYWARIASAASCVATCDSKIGVSIAPGLTQLTRIPRALSSEAQVRANER